MSDSRRSARFRRSGSDGGDKEPLRPNLKLKPTIRKKPHKLKERVRAASVAEASARRSGRLAGIRIPKDEHRANLDLGILQAQGNQQGGVGIPGPRTADAVSRFRAMNWRGGMSTDLDHILGGSEDARGQELEGKQRIAAEHNRQVVFQQGQTGYFSLHVANDVAGVWNSPTRGSKVYDYPDLTRSFEERFTRDASRSGETYFTGDLTADQRRMHVATGMQHVLAGDIDAANASFQAAGATQRGQKWINKFSTLMLAERAREVHAGIADSSQGLTHAALGEIAAGRSTFSAKFMPGVGTAAAFVGQGGADAHRRHARALEGE